ncbi:MAG: hypothetical protein WB341_17115 [Terracidiphilus sp.]
MSFWFALNLAVSIHPWKWHGRGRRFDPDQVHQTRLTTQQSVWLSLPPPSATHFLHKSAPDTLRVPIETLQGHIEHAITGSFTLDVHGGKLQWERNLEAARAIGAELERVVIEAEKKLQDEASAGLNDGLTPISTTTASDQESEAV